jgi:hypothetical protein
MPPRQVPLRGIEARVNERRRRRENDSGDLTVDVEHKPGRAMQWSLFFQPAFEEKRTFGRLRDSRQIAAICRFQQLIRDCGP